ncbi:DUF4105 domain-containing protein [Fulvivirga lutea]|uniref:DUF4105 domain-containing protein n=1 Tax=Fulvivirga lutea TaxID=2810512 RepID=A0A974WJ12_9BACT|nr:DUF4105 domain-containing protein [Fulvivirga lutea]
MHTLILVTLCLFSFIGNGQGFKLSEEAEIHVLTCGPYQGELYSAFGHSAIRVHDPKRGLDWLYNYGVFDFNQPNFYLNFARGYLNYKLAVMDYSRFRDYYIYQNRYIHEQVLNLNQEQKQAFFDFLQWNAQPENQYYYYDYFYDNCATRVRDALKTTFGEKVTFDGSYINTDYTIRELTDLYLTYQPWGDLGIDICLGLPMDKKATPEMYMFLPDYIESAFNNATIESDSGKLPLVKETIVTYESKPETFEISFFNPLNVFSILFGAILLTTVLGWKRGKHIKLIDVSLFGIIGLVGLLLFVLWVATDHNAAARNMNILWALPFHLIAAVLLARSNPPKWLKHYFLGYSILGVILVLTWNFLPQQMHYSLIPIVLILVVRSLFNYKKLGKAKKV